MGKEKKKGLFPADQKKKEKKKGKLHFLRGKEMEKLHQCCN